MAWNEPGGSKDRDPWGNRNQDQGPPDIDEVVKKMRDKFGGLFGGGGGRGTGGQGAGGLFSIIVLGLLAWLVYDTTYIIDPAERGVVLRFGKYVDTLQPGLNIRMPRPIENVVRVNVERVRTVALGSTIAESLMLTQDENIIDVEFNVQYKISNARDYVFNVREPDQTLRDATETTVREVVGKSKMDFVITEGRGVVATNAKQLLQEILDYYKTGLFITEFNMQDAQAPEQVQDAFADAVKAREDEVRFKNEAEAYERDLLGKAQGAVQRTLLDAQAYRSRVIESANGEAQRFEKLLTEYKKAPEVTRERLYIEAMQDVLSNSTKVMADMEGGNSLIYLPLDQLLKGQQQSGSPATRADQTSKRVTPQRFPGVNNTDDARSRGGR
jgi:membrane protease subunit HflK